MGSHYGAKYFPTASQNDKFGRAAVSAMFGGLGAEASGGSFEDGAMTALFVHLFNDAMADKQAKEWERQRAKHNKRINAILKKYKIDSSGLSNGVTWVPDVMFAPGGLNVERPSAVFMTNGKDYTVVLVADRIMGWSDGSIASVLGHEIEVHFKQHKEGRFYPNSDPVGTDLNEIEAYDYQIRTQKGLVFQMGM